MEGRQVERAVPNVDEEDDSSQVAPPFFNFPNQRPHFRFWSKPEVRSMRISAQGSVRMSDAVSGDRRLGRDRSEGTQMIKVLRNSHCLQLLSRSFNARWRRKRG